MKAKGHTFFQGTIRRAILRRFGADLLSESFLVRSPRLTMEEIIFEFPDEYQVVAEELVLKLCDEYVLLVECNVDDSVRYYLNPNRRSLSFNISSANRITFIPGEEILSHNFTKVLESLGSKNAMGMNTVYEYYRNKSDPYHFCMLIRNSRLGRPEKRDLGSLGEKDSVIYEVWAIIDEKIKSKFYKKDIYEFVTDYNKIVGNKQPLKASIDVLEYLGYIKKTGKRYGISDQYEKTGILPPKMGLDTFLGNEDEQV